MSQEPSASGPDLTRGVTLAEFSNGKLAGHVGDEQVLLVRGESGIFAIAPLCPHYHGPLAEGLVVGDGIRCPWHHACFDLRSGEAVRAPALDAIACWRVEEQDGRVFVREKRAPHKPAGAARAGEPGRIVIVGGGAAGLAAAEMLRRRNFRGAVVMLSRDAEAPVDRPNLSKDYLAGSASDDWLPLRSASFYEEAGIELRLNCEVVGIDAHARKVRTAAGDAIAYDKLLLALGAEPIRLSIPGADQPHIHNLRSLADANAIIEAAKGARRALVVGASFIGMEAAAAMRARNIEVHVVAPEKRPMERVLGQEMGDFIRKLYEEHGVIFHLENAVSRFEGRRAVLKSGEAIEAELVVVGIGVRPALSLAEQAGMACDRGVSVNSFLETSVPDIYAAGDIARWPDPHSAENIRVEHWVVAQRQGQTAALNMLGARVKFEAAPFFWSQHYDVPINYVGHAAQWDEIEIDGDIQAKDCLVKYKRKGQVLAVASIFRDLASLQAEAAMERQALPA